MLLFILLILGSIAIISLAGFSVYSGITPMPSNRKAVAAILSLIPPDFQGKIYDLGSGFGTLAFAIALTRPGAEVIGFEISPLPYLFAKLCFRRRNLTFRRKNYLKEELDRADLLVCYLYPGGMAKLAQKPFRRLISNHFSLPNHAPKQQLQLDDLGRTTIWFYQNG